ncbi:MAG: sel1 repeat family protein [Selenomonadaceae bacterium]|nr:sel1 repeat family protein [Selenomonadaceae bacterium]MBR4382682.1 sel1 repeat family protein [Selenomonadaceae bacterium]
MTNEQLIDCRRRANHGDISAMRELGNFLRDEAERNFSEAFKWFIKAANFGDAGAFLLVGDMCRFGQGTPKNPLKALDCYKKVANNSRVNLSDRQDAESRIAEIVDEIHGRKVDDLIAALTLANESDSHTAARILADIFHEGKFGVKKNSELALKILATDAVNAFSLRDQIIALRKSAEIYREFDRDKADEFSREAERLSHTWTKNFDALQTQ